MNPSVYIETLVIGYLTSWPRNEVTIAGHQNTTKQWWLTAAERFDLFVSQLVIRGCSDGDAQAVKDRLASIDGLPVLPITSEAEILAMLAFEDTLSPKPNPTMHCTWPWLRCMA